MSRRKDKDTLRDLQEWQDWMEQIRRAGETGIPISETAGEKSTRIAKMRTDFSEFVQYYFPHYAKYATPWFHIDLAERCLADREFCGILEWYRGGAKSVVTNIFIPMWLMIQETNEVNTVLLVSLNETMARNLLSEVQAELEANPRFIADFGEQMSYGDWAKGEFTTLSGVSFFARGLLQQSRGVRKNANRPDLILIDDVDSLRASTGEITARTNEIERSIIPTIEPSEDSAKRVLVSNNRIARDQVLVRLILEHPEWYHSKVKAVNDDQTSNWPEQNSYEGWMRLRGKHIKEPAWQTEYQLNPTQEGQEFKRKWIQWKERRPEDMVKMVCYIDPSWRKTGDTKAARLWGKNEFGYHLFECLVRQTTMEKVAKWCYELWERYKARHPKVIINFWVEGKFIQSDHLNYFKLEGAKRGAQLPIRADNRNKPHKETRIADLIPLYENGQITYQKSQEYNPDMQDGLTQVLTWEPGHNFFDDAPDADEGAIYQLNKAGQHKSGDIIVIEKIRSRHRT